MQERFDKQLKKVLKLADNQKKISVLAGVSGGPDSVCMLDLLINSNIELDISIAHMNFSLRGEDSDTDESFVRTLAGKYGIRFYSKKVDTIAYSKEHSVSIEMAARELRYNWFYELLYENNIDYLSVAHNANDNAETLMLNLIRGTGIRGICGIREQNIFNSRNDLYLEKDFGGSAFKTDRNFYSGNIIRPLLRFTRKEIENYIVDKKIEYRTDKTNFNSDYSRNRIRNEVMPQLEIINPSVVKTLNNDIDNFTLVYELLNDLISNEKHKFIEPFVKYTGDGTVEFFKNKLDALFLKCSINLAKVKATGHAGYYLFDMLNNYGFNSNQLRDLLQCIDSTELQKFFSENYVLVKERGYLKVYDIEVTERPSPVIVNNDFLFKADDSYNEKTVSFGNVTFRLNIEKVDNRTGAGDKKVPFIKIDFDKLKFPLKLKIIDAGDEFSPFGMRGKKKVNDFIAEKRIGNIYKSIIPVMVDENNRIVCIPSLEIDEKYRITEATSMLLKISVS